MPQRPHNGLLYFHLLMYQLSLYKVIYTLNGTQWSAISYNILLYMVIYIPQVEPNGLLDDHHLIKHFTIHGYKYTPNGTQSSA